MSNDGPHDLATISPTTTNRSATRGTRSTFPG